MVKPRDQDVVFLEDHYDDNDHAVTFDTPQNQSRPFQSQLQSQSVLSLSSDASFETSGNSTYKKLLLEYYDEYFARTATSSFHQQQVRKVFLERFRTEMAMVDWDPQISPSLDSGSTSTSASTSLKPQFLIHRKSKHGKSSCFTKVFFKPNIDQKIVSACPSSDDVIFVVIVLFLSLDWIISNSFSI